jgi:hypothetical protein
MDFRNPDAGRIIAAPHAIQASVPELSAAGRQALPDERSRNQATTSKIVYLTKNDQLE